MINAVRSVRANPPTLFSSPLPSHLCRKTSGVRFLQSTVDPKQSSSMDQAQNRKKPGLNLEVEISDRETGSDIMDVMEDSFGEGYATRSDEEGFGGVYGGNQSIRKDDEEEKKMGIQPEFDRNQGSEVKEKEKGRHQTSAAA